MTLRASARVAGIMFLLYIALGIAGLLFFNSATNGGDDVAIATLALHVHELRWAATCTLLTMLDAIVLGVTLFSLTRMVDSELAFLALACRIIEAAVNGFMVVALLVLCRLVEVPGAFGSSASAPAIVAFVLGIPTATNAVAATSFAVGSALFCYLFLRGCLIPKLLAGLGLFGSCLVAVGMPLSMLNLLPGPMAAWMWAPIAIFEIVVALWLLFNGIATIHAEREAIP
jgi:hypothetical protein